MFSTECHENIVQFTVSRITVMKLNQPKSHEVVCCRCFHLLSYMNKTWVSLKCHLVVWQPKFGQGALSWRLMFKIMSDHGSCSHGHTDIYYTKRSEHRRGENEKMLPVELKLKLQTVKTLRVWQHAGRTQSSRGLSFYQMRQVCVCVCFSFDNWILKTWNAKLQRAPLAACVHLVPQPWQNNRSLALGI